MSNIAINLPNIDPSTYTCESGGGDLGDGEPGELREDKVEKVLSHVDHDVVVLEDALQ